MKRALLVALIGGMALVSDIQAQPKLVDVQVTATDSQDPVVSGGAVAYEIKIRNLDPVRANVVPTLTLHAHNGLTMTALLVNGMATPLNGGTLLAGYALPERELAANEAMTVVVQASANRPPGTVYLEATVSINSLKIVDSYSGNNRVVESTRVVAPPLGTPPPPPPTIDLRPAALSVTISDSADPVLSGAAYEYVITVFNRGRGDVSGYSVSATPSGATGEDSGWNMLGMQSGGYLAAGDSRRHTFRVRAGAPGQAGLAVTVTPAPEHLELSIGNNQQTEPTTIVASGVTPPTSISGLVDPAAPPAVDLAVAVSDSPDPVNDGAILRFDVTVANNLDAAATAPMLTIIPPPEIIIIGIGAVGAFPPNCTGDPTIVCSLFILGQGRTVMTLFAQANHPPGGTVSTRFEIASSTREIDADDNARTEPTTIRPRIVTPVVPPAGDPGGPALTPGPGTGTIPPAPPAGGGAPGEPGAEPGEGQPGPATPPGDAPPPEPSEDDETGFNPGGGGGMQPVSGEPGTPFALPPEDEPEQPTVVDMLLAVSDSADPVDDGDTFRFDVIVGNSIRNRSTPSIAEVTIEPGPGIEIVEVLGYPVGERCQLNPIRCGFTDWGQGWRPFPVVARANLPAGGTVATTFTLSPGWKELDPTDNVRTETTTIRGSAGEPKGPVNRTPGSGADPSTGAKAGGPPEWPLVIPGTDTPLQRGGPPSSGRPIVIPGTDTPLEIQPTPPGTVPSRPTEPGGKLAGVISYDPNGDLFTPFGVDRIFEQDPAEPPPTGAPDLGLQIGLDPPRIRAGDSGTIYVDLQNGGDADASGVRLELDVAPQLRFEMAAPPQGTCEPSSDGVDCDLGAIRFGTNLRIPFTYRALEGAEGSFGVTGRLTLDQIDPNVLNNLVTSTIVIVPPQGPTADLMLTGSFTPQVFLEGLDGTFNLLAQNLGPDPAADVSLIFDVTDRMRQVEILQGNCTTSGSQVNCNLGTIPNGGSQAVSVRGIVSQGLKQTLTVTGTVSSETLDENGANNRVILDVLVQPAPPPPGADLELSTNAPSAVSGNQTIRYLHRVTNHGPASANGVVVTNTLDADATFVFCSPTCTPPAPGGRVITCTVPTLSAGASGSVFVDARSAVPKTLVNQASVSGTETDPMPANNTTTTSTIVNGAGTSGALGIAPGTGPGEENCRAPGAVTGRQCDQRVSRR